MHSNSRRDSTPLPDNLDLRLTTWLGRMSHGVSPSVLTAAFSDWQSHLAASPGKQLELAESALHKYLQWLIYLRSSHGQCPPSEQPALEDKRFKAAQWQ
ncbi:MAG: poly-beta-hydroxybutyrate polymerase N-terminal domain-containing protein, partial [Cytophagales bacterium]|nr:poly-beta-hydroxybutyrate polymerase N-terminal domain-containing protein [Rhizobacter sp.]